MNESRSDPGEPLEGLVKYGTVDWLFREYKQAKAYLEKVSLRSRRDYERTMLPVTTWPPRKGIAIPTIGVRNRTIEPIAKQMSIHAGHTLMFDPVQPPPLPQAF